MSTEEVGAAAAAGTGSEGGGAGAGAEVPIEAAGTDVVANGGAGSQAKPPSRSSFTGVEYHSSSGKFRAAIQVQKSKLFLGSYETEVMAAAAYDAARIDAGKPIVNGTTQAERAAAQRYRSHRRLPHREASSRFTGVAYKGGFRWAAQITVAGKHRHLGYFDDERLAAAAYDSARIKNGKKPVNGTTDEERVESEKYRAFRSRPTKEPSKNFKGVSWDKKVDAWEAALEDGTSVGHFVEEKFAAAAYDAALIADGKPAVNGTTAVERATAARARSRVRRPKKLRTSKYRGVTLDKVYGKWKAQITSGSNKVFLGYYSDDRVAGAAYDAARLALSKPAVNGSTEQDRQTAEKRHAALKRATAKLVADRREAQSRADTATPQAQSPNSRPGKVGPTFESALARRGAAASAATTVTAPTIAIPVSGSVVGSGGGGAGAGAGGAPTAPQEDAASVGGAGPPAPKRTRLA